jgi:hypothetical protein
MTDLIFTISFNYHFTVEPLLMISFGSIEEYLKRKKCNFDIIYFGLLELNFKLGKTFNWKALTVFTKVI